MLFSSAKRKKVETKHMEYQHQDPVSPQQDPLGIPSSEQTVGNELVEGTNTRPWLDLH